LNKKKHRKSQAEFLFLSKKLGLAFISNLVDQKPFPLILLGSQKQRDFGLMVSMSTGAQAVSSKTTLTAIASCLSSKTTLASKTGLSS
jgi:hypothetical protein